MSYSEHDHEPVRGLPGTLPEGEHMLWQGTPGWWALFRHACYLRVLAVYFGLVLVWQVAVAFNDGGGVAAAVNRGFWVGVLWLGLMLLLAFYCWLVGRTAVYTITDRRLVLRIGVAIPITLNLPFRVVERAGLNLFADGTGDLPLIINRADRVAFLVLWPHCRPWHFSRPQPMLRSVPDARRVADILGRALAGSEAARGVTAAAPAAGAAAPAGTPAEARRQTPGTATAVPADPGTATAVPAE